MVWLEKQRQSRKGDPSGSRIWERSCRFGGDSGKDSMQMFVLSVMQQTSVGMGDHLGSIRSRPEKRGCGRQSVKAWVGRGPLVSKREKGAHEYPPSCFPDPNPDPQQY